MWISSMQANGFPLKPTLSSINPRGIIYFLDKITFLTKVFQNNLDIHTTIIKSFCKGQKSLATIRGYAKVTKVLRYVFCKTIN